MFIVCSLLCIAKYLYLKWFTNVLPSIANVDTLQEKKKLNITVLCIVINSL